MIERRVHVERIRIDRALGIGRGAGFVLDGLCGGVNLICGSNGSGKSTTALVIEELLWPGAGALSRPTVAGTLIDGDRRWTIDIDAGAVSVLRDGMPSSLPGFAPTESRTRHHLALHDLIAATDHDFAARIALERRGGFDLDRAATDLKFTARPSAPLKLSRDVAAASHAVRDALQAQKALVAREQQLSTLRSQLARAQEADRRRAALATVLQWRQAADEHARLSAQLDALPPGVRALEGTERQRLDDLADRLARIDDSIASVRNEAEEAETTCRGAALPEGGVDEATIAAWRAQASELLRLERELERRESERDRAMAQVVRRRAMIGADVEEAALDAIDDTAQRDLTEHVRRAAELAADEIARAARERSLGRRADAQAVDPDSDTLRNAVAALGRWIAAAPATPAGAAAMAATQDGIPLALASCAIAVLSVVLAVVAHVAWLLGILLAAALFAWAIVRTHGRPGEASVTQPDERTVHRATFERLGVTGPSAWEPDAVTERIAELIRMLAACDRETTRDGERAQLASERSALEARRTALDAERAELGRRLGIPVESAPTWLEGFAANLRHWQEASAEASAATAETAGLRARCAASRSRLSKELMPLLPRATVRPWHAGSAQEAIAQIDSIAAREAERSNAVKVAARAARSTAALERDRQALIASRDSIYARLELESGDGATLDAWLERLDERKALERRLLEIGAVRDAERGKIADGDLLALDADELRALIEKADAEAATRDALRGEISRIEADVELAMRGHELEALIAGRAESLTMLEDERDRASDQVLGHQLIEYVRGVDAERSRPIVERRAAELLASFTRGTLTLRVTESTADSDGAASFLVQRGDGQARPLDALSRGERIQALIAVRLAFLEQEESAVLPLLLDETLATSDDRRTDAIIDTVIEIARGGRQVFCFTAQRDESAKWHARLDGRDVPFRQIDLDQVRGLARFDALPPAAPMAGRPQVPPPAGDDHAAYGARLRVPGIDPRGEAQDCLHLWHLIDDPATLHRCLAVGLESWGQLRTLIAHGAPLLETLALDAAALAAVEARARMLVRACELWRVGRAAPIDRAILGDADGISRTYLDRVVALSAECGGDAAALIERLARGDLERWRQENTERLREWLIAHGHLDDSPRLERDAIRIRLLADLSHDLGAGRVSTQFIDRILGGLPEESTHAGAG